MRLRWSAEAKLDADNILAYVGQTNFSGAIKILDKLDRDTELLRDSPYIGRQGRTAGTRELVVAPYVAVYRVLDDEIVILRIFHAAQDWP